MLSFNELAAQAKYVINKMTIFKLPDGHNYPEYMKKQIDMCFYAETLYLLEIWKLLNKIYNGCDDIIFIILKYYYLSIKLVKDNALFISCMDIGDNSNYTNFKGTVNYSLGTSVIITNNNQDIYDVKFFKLAAVSHNADETMSIFGVNNIDRKKYFNTKFVKVYVNLLNIVCIRKINNNLFVLVILTRDTNSDIHLETFPTVVVSDYAIYVKSNDIMLTI